jgi:alkylresorcinol/alkylpyrone synthase
MISTAIWAWALVAARALCSCRLRVEDWAARSIALGWARRPRVERVTTLAGVHAVLPPYRYAQAELTGAFTETCLGPDGNPDLVERLHDNAQVSSRHLVLSLERYATLTGLEESNDLFITHAVELGAGALTGALQRAGVEADEVDIVISTTITGIAVPSIEACIAELVGLRPDVKRVPLFGLGCVAGAAGAARLHDYLIGHPNEVPALLSVELCSLTVQRDDRADSPGCRPVAARLPRLFGAAVQQLAH